MSTCKATYNPALFHQPPPPPPPTSTCFRRTASTNTESSSQRKKIAREVISQRRVLLIFSFLLIFLQPFLESPFLQLTCNCEYNHSTSSTVPPHPHPPPRSHPSTQHQVGLETLMPGTMPQEIDKTATLFLFLSLILFCGHIRISCLWLIKLGDTK